MRKKRYSLPLFGVALLFLAGCAPRIPEPQLPKQQEPQRAMWNDTSYAESNYKLKPEPFSLDSKQRDPELLGPQSTIKRPLSSTNAESMTTEEFVPREDETPKSASAAQTQGAHPPMNRSRCISLIGKSKYNEYTKRFGSEEAAIRKCTILERVQGK